MRLSFLHAAPKLKLASSTATSAATKQLPPLVILHGLFGSKQNWKSLSRALADKLLTDVYALDLPNHGQSPWTKSATTYRSLSDDVCAFLNHHFGDTKAKTPQIDLMGHSMGGKVAMRIALESPWKDRVRRLVSVDMPPKRLAPVLAFTRYVEAMMQVERAHVKTKKEADAMLVDAVRDPAVRQFLLTNLVPREELHPSSGDKLVEGDPKDYVFRINLANLQASLPPIHGFLEGTENARPTFNRPTLFVYGTKSDYVKKEMRPQIQGLFPQAELLGLPTGHWVHSESPAEFVQAVSTFFLKE